MSEASGNARGIEVSVPTKSDSASKRSTLTRIAALLWGTGVAVLLGAILLGAVYTLSPNAPEGVVFTLFGYPYAASVIWIPLGIASLILVIIALARRERARRWAIALLVANVLSLPLVLVLWFVFLL